MTVGLDLCLHVGGEGGGAALEGHPPRALLAHLALAALAGLTHGVAALVGADALPPDLLAADPAQELAPHLPQLDAP